MCSSCTLYFPTQDTIFWNVLCVFSPMHSTVFISRIYKYYWNEWFYIVNNKLCAWKLLAHSKGRKHDVGFENRALSRYLDLTRGQINYMRNVTICKPWQYQNDETEVLRWVGHVAHMGMRIVSSVAARKPQGERPLWTPTCRWQVNIKNESYKNIVGGYGLDSSGTGQGEVMGSCKYNELLDSMKPWNSLTLQNPAAYFLSNTLHHDVWACIADTNTSQTSQPPPSVRSSYQLPFLLQLPWIALSQDSCL
jgi:hypothetical protein